MNSSKTLLIIGGGIVGISIAREAALRRYFKRITIIEKEKELGLHASSRNSGVIHAGFYYAPNTSKALFCSEANNLLRNYCIEKNVEVKKSGKVVVCNDKNDVKIIDELYQRGINNSAKIFLLKERELSNYEPLALTSEKFIWSPNTWSANPRNLIKAIKKELIELNVKIVLNRKIVSQRKNTLIDRENNKYHYDFLINAAGAHSLKIAQLFNIENDFALLPFRGMYLKSKKKVNSFKRHIYPVPDIRQPFLGIHTTLSSDGYLKLGPTAIPVLSPENYNNFSGIDLDYLPNILINQTKLFLNNSFGYRDLAFRELKNLRKKNIIASAQKLTKLKLFESDFEWYSPGIRAQLFNKKSGKLAMDFVNIKNSNQYHILNSISPAWTCSFKTADFVVNDILGLIK